MANPIDPIVDYVFKAIFTREKNKAAWIHFLNSVMKAEGKIESRMYP